MAFKSGYSRRFITLNQECKEYNISSKQVFGRGVIEVRNGSGRVIIQSQGLKPDVKYEVLFVGSDKYATASKAFGVDSQGRSEYMWEFDPNDIAKSGLALEEVSALGIVVEGEKSPLMGYVNGSYDWQSVVSRDKGTKPVLEAVPVEEEPIKEQPVKEDSAKEESIKEETIKEEAIKEEKAKVSEEQGNTTQPADESLKEIIFEFNENLEELKYYASIKSSKDRDIDYIFKTYKEVKPFGEDGVQWININLRELALVGGDLWKYMNNPFVTCGCRRFKHLILGRFNKNGERFILGVPCNYDREYKLEANMQGFDGFKPLEGKELEQGEFCYCLLKI